MVPLPKATGQLKVAWRTFWSPPRSLSLGAILIVGILAGSSLLWVGNALIQRTNSLEFCISCHEMRATVYEEYKKSPHYSNPSGVRVTCSDCHVPRSGLAMLVRKIEAAADIYHTVAGTISTPEKFEVRRRLLAERVWDSMLKNDSRECRACHSYEAMAFHKQSNEARQKMKLEAAPNNKSCIECHKGIAHKFPPEPRDD